MICPSCHTENIEGADDCVNCGESLYGLDLPDAGLKDPSPDFIHETIAGLPRRPPPFVDVNDPLALALSLMQHHGSRGVLVRENGKLGGIITGSDFLTKVAGPNRDFAAITCGAIMTPDPLCLNEDDTIALAINMMASGHFRHLPILKDGEPVTVINVNDVFMYISPNMV